MGIAVEEAPAVSGGPPATGDPTAPASASAALSSKKAREAERLRRRRKQKKKNAKLSSLAAASASASTSADESDDAKPNSEPRNEIEGSVEVEYVPEKAEIEDSFLEEFKTVFEKFSFVDAAAAAAEDAKKDEVAENGAAKKKGDSDSEEEEQENQEKEKGLSNKKKKMQRRMKIAELKQISSRPDVVEVWDATSADPKLLVFLKAYRNTVPVPRHWCQKRKFLQGPAVTVMEPELGGVFQKRPLSGFSFGILLGWCGVVRCI